MATFLGLIFALVALVLLITCANVAGMLTARAAARERDTAIRLALGVSRPRLVRQLVTESLVLFVLGGIAGAALAVQGAGLISSITSLLPETETVVLDVTPDVRVFAFGLLCALVTGLLFGLAPALQTTTLPPDAALRRDPERRGSRGSRLRRAFVSEYFAATMWPDQDPRGRRVRVFADNTPWRTVVGVVADVKNQTLSESASPVLYLPAAQEYSASTMLLARGTGAAAGNSIGYGLRLAVPGLAVGLLRA